MSFNALSNISDNGIVLKNRYVLEKNCFAFGSFGQIFKAEDKNELNSIKAVKKIDISNMSCEEKKIILQEGNTLSILQHQNILTYYESFACDQCFWLITEFCDEGNLRSYIKRTKFRIDIEEETINYIENCIDAVKYIHSKKIIHRDIKPENIFIKNHQIKLGDFGLAKENKNTLRASSSFGTIDYRSPELFVKDVKGEIIYNEKTDIWALGVTLYELCVHAKPFKSISHLLEQDFKVEVLNVNISDSLKLKIYNMLEKDPKKRSMNDLDAYKVLLDKGNALRRLGRYEGAMKLYDEAIKIKIDNHKALYYKGILLHNNRKYEEAIKLYTNAIDINENFYEAWNNMGDALDEMGKYDEAIVSYDKAIAIKKDYYLAFNNKGVTLKKLKKYEEALVSFKKAIEIKSDSHEAWNNIGNVWNNLGNYEEALKSYNKAIAIKNDYHHAWNNKGIILKKEHKFEESIASFLKAVEINKDFYEAWNNMGDAYDEMGKYDEAIISYDKAIAIKKDYYLALNNKGVTLKKLKKYEEAIESFQNAISFKKYYVEAWNNIRYMFKMT